MAKKRKKANNGGFWLGTMVGAVVGFTAGQLVATRLEQDVPTESLEKAVLPAATIEEQVSHSESKPTGPAAPKKSAKRSDSDTASNNRAGNHTVSNIDDLPDRS